MKVNCILLRSLPIAVLFRHVISVSAVGTMLLFTSCAQYATVKDVRPTFRPVRSTITALASVEQNILSGQKQERKDPLAALGEYLDATRVASEQLLRYPDDKDALDAYNFGVARVFGTLKKADIDPWTQPLRVPSSSGETELSVRPDPRKQWNPALYELTPADEFDVDGTYVTKRQQKEGLGAPLVAVGKEANEDADTDFTMQRIFYGVTAMIRFEGPRAVIAIEDPLATERVTYGGHSFPLAADFTVPLAVMLASTKPKKLELSRLLRPAKYAETARIARLEPYNPDKSVVLVIHGLMDSPATWAPMINHLRGDPEIRHNYQFWFYSYPSGYPYPYSASILRQKLDAIEERFPLKKKMVVVGHSMGGCISRLLITDTGDKVWMDIFNKSPDEVNMSPESRELFTDALIFRHRPEVGRVIFLAAPLRGSNLASNWLGRLGSKLVKSPVTLLRAGSDAMSQIVFQKDALNLKRIPNSVDTMAPNNGFVRAINKIPLTSGIPYHVICGDRGKGGNRDQTEPVMSDGFVPYWSSSLPDATSELIVPSNHSVQRNPEAMDEVKRILKKYAR